MLRIAGKITSRGNDEGIPNLVVAAYDVTGMTPQGSRESSPSQEIGRRIASVLTNDDGSFEIALDDLRFVGNEERPDLVLRVFAPEDVDEKTLAPLPSDKRLLYVSALPRRDAGAREAFFIRLPPDLLDRFGLSSGQRGSTKPDLLRALERSQSERDVVREATKNRNAALHERSTQINALARRSTSGLNGIPPHLRNGLLVDLSKLIVDRTQLADNLPRMLEDSANEAFARWKSKPRPLNLNLTTEQAQALGLTVDEAGAIEGDAATVDPLKVAALIRTLFGGTDLVRKRGLNNPPVDVLRAMYLNDTPSEGK